MNFVVRKYVAYLVFDNDTEEKEQGWVWAFESRGNKIMPAIFESHETSPWPYYAAMDKAKELNSIGKPPQQPESEGEGGRE